jgi:LDH2 family malate/lactate/ureidoglycolate dehydrogenase
MDRLVQRVHAVPPAKGFDEVIMPGETERRLEASRRRTGLPYHAKEVAALQKEAAKAGLPALPVSNGPLALP